MAKNLVIVESPAKMKTIKKFLGSSYTVDASMGHVRDLPKSTMGVDVDNGYEPKYITIRGKGDLIAALKKEASKADKIYLATDPDREGEAISWHLKAALGLDDPARKVYRITFNEITKEAVTNAIKHPRSIDMNLVDAQQGRRVIDRIVGYSISPLLWEKIKRGLSAGRVQSVALRMVCDRDAEIAAFIPQEYHTVDATIKHGTKTVKAQYYGENGRKKALKTAAEAQAIVDAVKDQDIFVAEVKDTDRVKNAPWPFTTSTLQQEASRSLNLSTQQTMRIAQKLYEDGRITYLRTDSIRVSDAAVAAAKSFIAAEYGDGYVSHRSAAGKSGSNVQDAHEAIRPTEITETPAKIKDKLANDEFRLYQLIWKRFVASRMNSAVYAQTTVRLTRDSHIFTAAGSKLKFDGFLKVYRQDKDDEELKQDLSFLKEGMTIRFAEVKDNQHFTEPPAHYTEATLVRALEEDGIGRPSTYAPTIGTLLGRSYVAKEKKNLFATELGMAVNELMVGSFPEIVDTGFTARMEERLDNIAEGKENWKDLVSEFYPDLEQSVQKARETLGRIKVADEVTDVICDKCGRNMVIKYGPHGKFLACPGFPECRNTKPLLEKAGVRCPKCGGEIIKRRTKKGRLFYACENKDCDFISWQKPGAKGKKAAEASAE
ncbi:MAG: type I DNA topoisomerase [Lachnospiraceae bacterium]|nr:type I DNA topoisomerase [Lachnospiraceae bacterium]